MLYKLAGGWVTNSRLCKIYIRSSRTHAFLRTLTIGLYKQTKKEKPIVKLIVQRRCRKGEERRRKKFKKKKFKLLLTSANIQALIWWLKCAGKIVREGTERDTARCRNGGVENTSGFRRAINARDLHENGFSLTRNGIPDTYLSGYLPHSPGPSRAIWT